MQRGMIELGRGVGGARGLKRRVGEGKDGGGHSAQSALLLFPFWERPWVGGVFQGRTAAAGGGGLAEPLKAPLPFPIHHQAPHVANSTVVHVPLLLPPSPFPLPPF